MPTPETVIAQLRAAGDIHLPSGTILPLIPARRNVKNWVQYRSRFNGWVHYEVVTGYGIPSGCLHVRVDVELENIGSPSKKRQLVKLQNWLVAKAGESAIRDEFKHNEVGDDLFHIWLSEPIRCEGQDDVALIREQVVRGLDRLYSVFETTLEKAEKTTMTDEIQKLLESNLNLILTGAPGTGKTFSAKKVSEEMITEGLASDDEKKKAMDERFKSVQFHPGYDYADFVIGMKPVLVSSEGKEVFKDGNGLYTTDDGTKDGNKTLFCGKTGVSFQWKDGIFKDFADEARKAYDAAEDKANAPKFVFLVDEINRADLSRVFGELFSLLEEGYRYPNGKDSDFVLLPNGERFSIPKNLYVIGTMNDIDRSVESMDFALRRRFAWKEVKPEDTADDILASVPQKETLLAKMNAVNELIRSDEFRLGCEYQLGGAIFAKFTGDYDELWHNHIANILNEYLRGRRDRDDRLKELKDAYDGGTDDAADEGEARTEDNANAGTAPRTRGANKKFRIVFQDGTEIGGSEKSGVETLVEFVRRVGYEKGFEQIAALGLVRGGKSFLIMGEVGETEAPFYKQVAEGVFVCVYSGNDEKVSQIARIINEFSLHARVEYL